MKIDGRLFTEYLVRSGTKPILWPIIGPTGKPMTRDFPMRDRPGETKDHPHQRSLWFSHGSVNGIDFWAEQGKVGTIKHLEFTKIAGGKPAVVATRNAWLAPDGRRVCEDQRVLRFDSDGDARWIDFDITLKASDGELVFGDTKEGTFGVRVAASLSVDARRGGKIVNSRGQTNGGRMGPARRLGRLPRTDRRRDRRHRHPQSPQQLSLSHALARANLRAVRRQSIRLARVSGRQECRRHFHARARRKRDISLSRVAAPRRRTRREGGREILSLFAERYSQGETK